MLGKIKEFFKGEESDVSVDKSGRATEFDLQVAVVVLLVEMAGSDHEIDPAEAEAICSSVSGQFQIQEDQVPELVQIAIAARNEVGKIDNFIGLINGAFNPSQRQRLLAMVWKVVLADGVVEKFEERFATQLLNRFQLSEQQGKAARSMAESGEV